MASRNYYFLLLTGTLIICITAIGTGLSFFLLQNNLVGFALIVVLIIEISIFIHRLNSVNRKIASFFYIVQNEDTSIQLPKNSKNKIINEIYHNLTALLELFQQMKMKTELREQLFLAMIEHSSTGFISIDEHGDFEIMNDTARKMLGVTHTSNMKRLKTEIPELYKVLSALQPGQVMSCPVNNADFSSIIQISCSILKFNDKKLTLVSLLDIKKEIEARELESWQKLIRIMNHEIMNSIAPITSVSKSLINIFFKDNKPVQQKEITEKKINDTINGLEVIESMSSGLNHFVENYRQLSKVPKPVVKGIEIKKWIDYLNTVSKDFVTENSATIHFKDFTGNSIIMGDERLLNQVMLNLIKNAAEAPESDESKVIFVEINPTEKGQIMVSVKNNGSPINEEIMDKIFIPFFSTKEKGAGIGLFLSRQIISLHNSSISIYSDKNRGTIFQFIL